MKKFFLLVLLAQLSLFAAPKSVRWTFKEDKNSGLLHILDVIKSKTGIELSIADFILLEEKKLATSHFKMLNQITSNKVPIRGQNLRIWTHLVTNEVIQVEAVIDVAPPIKTITLLTTATRGLSSQQTMSLVENAVKQSDDPFIRNVEWKDYYENNDFIRIAKVKSKYGTHKIIVSVTNRKVLSHTYDPYAQVDEISLPADVYPIYEEVEGKPGKQLSRVRSELRYINTKTKRVSTDPYTPLKSVRYIDEKWDPILGLTVEGRKQGFWSMGYLKNQIANIYSAIAISENNFSTGMILDGRYATINLHPDIVSFKNIDFTPAVSPIFRPNWRAMKDKPGHEEMIPSSTFLGRPIFTETDVLKRPAQRLKDHNPVQYINDGFDEVQVYWAINQMFDSLKDMGFVDPELSTRKFNAFLFDPDITYQNNAYYTDDTINFTTYSGEEQNMARDNTTIWHELGHGVMDRLMGDYITLADTGGLSEGMADFVAQMVLNDITDGKDFEGKEKMRIINNMGFNLTNEVHDDGEAYGGAMNDLLVNAMKKYGKAGLHKVTDLTLEAMRLTRNHPGLTANDWFDHMLFADEMGKDKVRAPSELKALILDSLASRNFNLDGSKIASFSMKNATQEVVPYSPGSRQNPVPVSLTEKETKTYNLTVNLESSKNYAFKYPVTVKVGLVEGPLQGAIHWKGEENKELIYTINSESDKLPIDLTIEGKCDKINRPDGSCVDFAYVQIFNQGETKKPQAKKRFYLKLKTKT